ncbi:transcriptional repressor LexA [Sinanaerobacter chloroacetimidivorans]|jgi:repressor LexA|uniref:LexA repressor n=1 Tax=Sinanaerobacter chloroacetimidivorans TaxID=2818044 RepID=A0A8J8B2M2_9FIRM|nr:transcriptional repressor LexA [Sinanaerobacter chloroacetimidivorans]MBR0599454.1 transcriptional repressor LexA [Sinanaerobacter chloroacetimidivorans]
MEPLKDRERKILIYMKNEIKKKGYPPTVREMCTALGIKSTSTTHKDLENLEKKGYIRKDPSKPRALMIIDPDGAGEKEEAVLDSGISAIGNTERTDVVDIPVVGRIAAGTPILADQNIEDTFPVPARFLSKGNNFMLTVRGESMVEAGILDGDYILVQQQNTANNGDIVVAMVDGFESEATVKTFYREKGHIRLQPENQNMSPIIVSDVKILGLVKGVFRYF